MIRLRSRTHRVVLSFFSLARAHARVRLKNQNASPYAKSRNHARPGRCAMRLTLWTDYALRTPIYVGAKGGRLSTIAEIAESFDISKTHLMRTPRGSPAIR
jgi:hypothetical protein